jgi:hypothetical protein
MILNDTDEELIAPYTGFFWQGCTKYIARRSVISQVGVPPSEDIPGSVHELVFRDKTKTHTVVKLDYMFHFWCRDLVDMSVKSSLHKFKDIKHTNPDDFLRLVSQGSLPNRYKILAYLSIYRYKRNAEMFTLSKDHAMYGKSIMRKDEACQQKLVKSKLFGAPMDRLKTLYGAYKGSLLGSAVYDYLFDKTDENLMYIVWRLP